MGNIFDLTPITDLLSQISPAYRPALEITLFVIAAIYLIAQVVNPIWELLQRIWGAIVWVATRLLRWARRVFGRPPPPPPLTPKPEIPDELTIWEVRAPAQPASPNPHGIPIITIAAQKGGVGKTTIAANLAPYFRSSRNKRVLVIDFDYQGSLSRSMRGEANYSDPDITSHVLITPANEYPNPELYAREMRRGLEDIFLFPADYQLATIENNLMIDWVNNPTDDLMYRLCLHLRSAAFQEKFGAVIIDSPPRLTTGSINALCGSTHILVPTTLDDMSAQAATYFLKQIDRMKTAARPLFASLKIVGVVPSIVSSEGTLQSHEAQAIDTLNEFGSRLGIANLVLEESRVPRRAEIARAAGRRVAYLHSARIAQIFDRLGRAIDARL